MTTERAALLEHTQLPTPGYTGRWTPSIKAGVACAISLGQITIAEAKQRWPGLSDEEITTWLARWRAGGNKDLRAVKGLQKVRPSNSRYRRREGRI